MSVVDNESGIEWLADDYWQEDDGNITLFAYYCNDCETGHLPKTLVCSNCGNDSLIKKAIQGNGRLYTYTILDVVPQGYPGPVSVGYVDFPDGVRVFGHIRPEQGCEIRIGSEVSIEPAVLFHRLNTEIEIHSYRFVIDNNSKENTHD